MEKLHYPEIDPCYLAMAGTSLFTHTTFDMLQNHSRYSGVLLNAYLSPPLRLQTYIAQRLKSVSFLFLTCKIIQWWSRVTLKTTKLHSMGDEAFCSAALRLWKTLSDHPRAPQTGDFLKCGLKTSHSLFFLPIVFYYLFLLEVYAFLWHFEIFLM